MSSPEGYGSFTLNPATLVLPDLRLLAAVLLVATVAAHLIVRGSDKERSLRFLSGQLVLVSIVIDDLAELRSPRAQVPALEIQDH